MSAQHHLAIRWTIGDVSPRGFEALGLSIWGAWHVFGPDAAYVVCVNSIELREARQRAGPVPPSIRWQAVGAGDLPVFLRPLLARNMAQGTGWKFAPLSVNPRQVEIALDNDAILWAMPPSIQRWLAAGLEKGECLLAQDVRGLYGQFTPLVPSEPPLNSGIRGLPPGFDFASALRRAIETREHQLGAALSFGSELDEQGLQAAALARAGPLHTVSVDEVSICSPFPPHRPNLGRCGAHFVGLNTRHIDWDYYGRPADDCMAEHWQRHRAELYARTGAPMKVST